MNIDIQIERCAVEKLIPRTSNPRTHTPQQIAQVAASIGEFGWTNPILLGADNDVIAGHARLLAARMLGMTEVPVIRLSHLSEGQRRALVIADNQLALNSGWDEELLRIELLLLQDAACDLSLVGFDDDELARLLAQQDAAEGLTDEDAVPALPETPVSASGDLWVLGSHRLLCGDATIRADVERLIGGETADLVFTDPPYNVDYEGYTEDKLKIRGDRMSPEQFQQFLAAAFSNYRRIAKAGASLYVCHSSSWQREFQNSMASAGFEVRCQIIWANNTFAGASGVISSSTSRSSTLTSPGTKMPGMEINRSQPSGRRRSRRPIGFTPRRNRWSLSSGLSSTAASPEMLWLICSAARVPR